MNVKVARTTLGAIGVFLWFMPLIRIDFLGINAFQAGNNIGGIAYLLLLALFGYSVLSWMELDAPRFITALMALAVSVVLLMQGGTAAWGLYGLLIISSIGVFIL